MLTQNKVAKGEEHGYCHRAIERAARLNDAQRRDSRMARALERDARMQQTMTTNDEQENAS